MPFAAWDAILHGVQDSMFAGIDRTLADHPPLPTLVAGPAPVFEAWCDCPECGHFACHWLRAPRTDPVSDVPAPPEASDPMSSLYENVVLGFFGTVRDLGVTVPNPEAKFEVIRICVTCGHEWGMT